MRGRSLLLILLGLAAVGLLIERIVITDAEAIEGLASDAEEAFNERRFGDLVDILDPDFSYGGRDRQGTVAYLERMAKRFQATGVDVVLEEPAIEGDEASAEATVRLRMLNRLTVVPVSLRFARRDGRWRFKQASLGAGLR